MPTDFEKELLAMAAAQRQQPDKVESGPNLPDLHPDMLLSASARQEFEAAQSLRGRPHPHMAVFQPPPQRPERELAPRPTRTVQAAAEVDFFETGSDGFELTDQDLAPAMRGVQASEGDDFLTSLFMNNREAQDALNVGVSTSSGGGGFDVAFDMDTGDRQGLPNESARWRVGRESPPVMPFDRTPPVRGPSDGVVVSSRGQGGTWESRPAPTEVRQAQVSRHEAVARQEQARVAAAPKPVPVRVSRYDLITSDD